MQACGSLATGAQRAHRRRRGQWRWRRQWGRRRRRLTEEVAAGAELQRVTVVGVEHVARAVQPRPHVGDGHRRRCGLRCLGVGDWTGVGSAGTGTSRDGRRRATEQKKRERQQRPAAAALFHCIVWIPLVSAQVSSIVLRTKRSGHRFPPEVAARAGCAGSNDPGQVGPGLAQQPAAGEWLGHTKSYVVRGSRRRGAGCSSPSGRLARPGWLQVRGSCVFANAA